MSLSRADLISLRSEAEAALTVTKTNQIGPSSHFRISFSVTAEGAMEDGQSHALCTPQGQESPEAYPLPYPRSGPRTFPKKPMVTAEEQGPGQAASHLKKAVCEQGILDERGEYLPTLPPGRWGPSLQEMQSVGTVAGGSQEASSSPMCHHMAKHTSTGALVCA